MNRQAVARELVVLARELAAAESLLSEDTGKVSLSEVQREDGGTAKGVPSFLANMYPDLRAAKTEPNVFTFRGGYFYRHGIDDAKFAKGIASWLEQKGFEATLVRSGDHWAPFSGGAKLFGARSSFFWAVFKVSRK